MNGLGPGSSLGLPLGWPFGPTMRVPDQDYLRRQLENLRARGDAAANYPPRPLFPAMTIRAKPGCLVSQWGDIWADEITVKSEYQAAKWQARAKAPADFKWWERVLLWWEMN